MEKFYKRLNNYGQSLFEVVVAVGMAAIVLVAISSLSTASLKSSTSSKNNALATKYAQDGMEWIREQRDMDWDTFELKAGTSGCLPQETNTASPGYLRPIWGSGSCSVSEYIANLFDRTYSITATATADLYKVVVKVEWDEGGKVQVVETVNQLSNWQNRGTQ